MVLIFTPKGKTFHFDLSDVKYKKIGKKWTSAQLSFLWFYGTTLDSHKENVLPTDFNPCMI